LLLGGTSTVCEKETKAEGPGENGAVSGGVVQRDGFFREFCKGEPIQEAWDLREDMRKELSGRGFVWRFSNRKRAEFSMKSTAARNFSLG